MSPFEINVVRVSDPLSPHTRSVRKALLIASVIAIFVSTTGLVPEKISALGIDFSQTDRGTMLRILVWVLSFQLLSFIAAAASDFVAWRMSFAIKAWEEESQGYANVIKAMLEKKSLTEEERDLIDSIERQTGSMWRGAGHLDRFVQLEQVVRPVSWLRAFVEFVAPLCAGVTSIVFLVRAVTSVAA